MVVWVLLLVAVTALAQTPVTCPSAALSEAQVLELVNGHVPEGRIVQIVGTCHIGFFPSFEVLERLQAAGSTPAVVDALRADGFARITLVQARQEVEALERRVRALTQTSDAERDRELAQLDADLAKASKPKDEFENRADQAKRVAEAKAKHDRDRDEVSARYTDGLTRKTRDLNHQIEALRGRTYPVEGAKPEFANYDADRNRLLARIDREEYCFTVPNDAARELHGRWTAVQVTQPFQDDSSRTRYLLDSATGGQFAGIPKTLRKEMDREAEAKAVAEATAEAETRAATEHAERVRQKTLHDKAAGWFVRISPGEFVMGGGSGKHQVRITKAFEMGKFEVTQAQWEAAMGKNPSEFQGADRPVDQVSWVDAQAFIERLNAVNDGYHYRLPTEAEWEYAARAGRAADDVSNLGTVAWYSGNSGSQTHPVGQKKPNSWGLHDMLGNVWEWCADWYDEKYYATSPAADPQGPASGTYRVVRGGSWGWNGEISLSYRAWVDPTVRTTSTGFRLVRDERSGPRD